MIRILFTVSVSHFCSLQKQGIKRSKWKILKEIVWRHNFSNNSKMVSRSRGKINDQMYFLLELPLWRWLHYHQHLIFMIWRKSGSMKKNWREKCFSADRNIPKNFASCLKRCFQYLRVIALTSLILIISWLRWLRTILKAHKIRKEKICREKKFKKAENDRTMF